MIQNNDVFANLTSDELKLSSELRDVIIHEIQQDKIPLSRYIELALYHPLYGYYSNPKVKFGQDGDFITAPLLSDLFASCLVNQLNQLLDNITVQEPCILEFGAGNGQLMLDILKHDIANRIKEYQIIELSSELRRLQQDRLKEHLPHLVGKVKWLDSVPNSFDGIILGNEVLDAMACDTVTWKSDGSILKRYVTLDSDNNFIYCDEAMEPDAELFRVAHQLINQVDNDFTSEISVLSRGFVKTLANILNTGYIVLIDYGHSQNEYYQVSRNGGTLRGFYRQHLLDDILLYPGLIDITSSVEFTAIATTGIDHQLDLIGYTTQANFLINCGILDIVKTRQDNLSSTQQVDLFNQVNYLTSPNLMGDIFKVIGFSKNIDFDNWMGFSYNDRSYTL